MTLRTQSSSRPMPSISRRAAPWILSTLLVALPMCFVGSSLKLDWVMYVGACVALVSLVVFGIPAYFAGTTSAGRASSEVKIPRGRKSKANQGRAHELPIKSSNTSRTRRKG